MSHKNKQKRTRTYARNRLFSRKGKEVQVESDVHYLIKLFVVFILSTIWLRFNQPIEIFNGMFTAFPVGFFGGLIAIHALEKYQFNRKIMYAVLLISTLISYYLPTGIIV